MSEIRKPAYIITKRDTENRTTVKIEVFRKSQWTDNPADEFEYRVRIDRIWYGGKHGKMTFLDGDGVMALVRQTLVAGGIT
jgi:hypothetical protein